MLATTNSGALMGVEALPVLVEVNSGQTGEMKTVMVGLPDAAVKESTDRVMSALGNSGFKLPKYRTTVNLAPGDLRKEGSLYDLPIALCLLAATDQMKSERLKEFLVAGELSLSGEVRPIKGALPLALLAKKLGKKLMLPAMNAREATLVDGVEVYAVKDLSDAMEFLNGTKEIVSEKPGEFFIDRVATPLDFCDVKGQAALRRAVEVAVSGGHNMLILGPPGSGKSMVAKRLPTILPQPTREEFLSVLAIHSSAGMTVDGTLPFSRPFRAPHHTISDAGLLGGGSVPKPGEVSLAHHGVLFLDEFPEFQRSALEVLRQPLEDGSVTISRSAAKITLPCECMLVAAMNPCPCGHLGDTQKKCRCSAATIERYRSRVSGPLLDRIDIHVEAPAVGIVQLREQAEGESSANIRTRVEKVRTLQRQRYQSEKTCNARMTPKQLRENCALGAAEEKLLVAAMNKLGLSARAHDKILKVARTIADMTESEKIESQHLMEAIGYRSLDRQKAV
jgi:magnesium chelatase family protein